MITEYKPLKNKALNRFREYRLRWALNFLQNEKNQHKQNLNKT